MCITYKRLIAAPAPALPLWQLLQFTGLMLAWEPLQGMLRMCLALLTWHNKNVFCNLIPKKAPKKTTQIGAQEGGRFFINSQPWQLSLGYTTDLDSIGYTIDPPSHPLLVSQWLPLAPGIPGWDSCPDEVYWVGFCPLRVIAFFAWVKSWQCTG